MERLMVIRLASRGCTAEAWFNGLPLARVTPSGREVVVPAHEAALTGPNRLDLVLGALHGASNDAVPQTAPHDMAAQLQLLLPRVGDLVDDAQSRVLAQVEWACAAGELYTFPKRQVHNVDLPIRFPRWRWLDAPVVQPSVALTQKAHALVSGLANDLARGQNDSFVMSTRLRTEELALAYQRSPDSETARLREWLEQMYAVSRLVWQPLALEQMRLQPLAGGRLLECLSDDGRAALTTVPDKAGNVLSLPLKVSLVEGQFYVLR